MKIKVGRRYKTRDGQTAFISLESSDGFWGIIVGNSCEAFWYANGRAYESGQICDLDLIAPWPKKVKKLEIDPTVLYPFKKPVYQWAYWACAEGNWRTDQKLLNKEQATREYVNTEAYRIHAGPFEGSEP